MDDVEAIAALQDPVRRRLYEYVAGQDHEVGRAEAADAAGIQRTLAAFHLDRLTDVGLLEAIYRRPAGRTGPGAGRPAKLYRRSAAERVVSVPPRDYRAAAELLAEVVETVGGEEVLERLARAHGRSAGAARPETVRAERATGATHAEGTAEAVRAAGAAGTAHAEGAAGTVRADGAAWTAHADGPAENGAGAAPDGAGNEMGDRVEGALAARGYEPYREGEQVRLRNCPFHALAVEFPPLVCGMNLALLEGLLEGLGPTGMAARMDPRPGECCVVLASKNNDS
ncbi:helix-turn-helix transcriptional regulator [Actinoallomurus sp. CA-150999]|uniref:helix-turn-helix transcriptional regulator n=1 Tax=Actinoallomurus sp. CA-150999 TaxID=3239887 RepID=UPI003D91A03A